MNSNITPRRMHFPNSPTMAQDWMAGNAFITQFFSAFTAQFPEGERFLVHSVRLFRDQLPASSQVRQDAAGFIGQEAHHANAHEDFNSYLEERGVPAKAIDKQTAWALKLLKAALSDSQQLALTAGLEHFTSLFGDLVLSHPEIIDGSDPAVQPLILWHAWEETEHKAVAFDVYQTVAGQYSERIAMFLLGTVLLGVFTAVAQARITAKDPRSLKPKSLLTGLNWMFGFGENKGHLRRAIPYWADYLRRDFHPWQHDNRDLLEAWLPKLKTIEKEFSYRAAA